jgi:MFS family permease
MKFKKYNQFLLICSRNFFILSLFLFFLEKFEILNITKYLSSNFLFGLMVFFGFAWFFFFIRRDEEKYKKVLEPYFKYGFLVGLIFIIVTSLKLDFINNIEILRRVISFLSVYTFKLTLFIISFGFFTFYFHKEDIKKEIEDEKDKNELEEDYRNHEFNRKFPRIAKLDLRYGFIYSLEKRDILLFLFCILISPLILFLKSVYQLIKWIYKEGFVFSLGLIIITLIGFVLRLLVFNFVGGVLEDEFATLTSVEQLLREGFFQYPRNSFLVHIIAFLFKVTGNHSIFIARIPTVLFGTATIIGVYFLGKRINKSIGIISAYIWSFLPVAIGISGYIREYSLNGFIIVFSLIYLLFIYDCATDVSKNGRLLKTRDYILAFIIFLFLGIYAFFFEASTLLRFLFSILSGVTFFYFLFIFWLDISRILDFIKNNRKIIALILMIVFIGFFIAYLDSFSYLSEKVYKNTANEYFAQFFNPQLLYIDSAAMWFSNTSIISIFILSTFFLSLFFFYKNQSYFVYITTFLTFFLILSYIASQYFAPRFAFYIFPLYVLVFASSVYILIKMSLSIKSWLGFFSIMVIIILLTNPMISFDFITHAKLSNKIEDRMIGIPLRNSSSLDDSAAYIRDYNSTKEFIVLTNNPGVYYSFYSQYENKYLKNIYIINWFERNNQSIGELIETHPSGILIASNNLVNLVEPTYSLADDYKTSHLGSIGSMEILNWEKLD